MNVGGLSILPVSFKPVAVKLTIFRMYLHLVLEKYILPATAFHCQLASCRFGDLLVLNC